MLCKRGLSDTLEIVIKRQRTLTTVALVLGSASLGLWYARSSPTMRNVTLTKSRKVYNENADLGGDVGCGDGIPAVIVQTFKAAEKTPIFVRSNWSALNPTFEYKFFNDSESRAFVAAQSPAHAVLYDALPENKYKADFFRYCYLYRFGGVYADIDLKPLVALRSFIDRRATFFTVWAADNPGQVASGNPGHLFQAYIAVKARHPIMRKAIQRMLKVGTSFYNVPWPHASHPTNQLYEIVRDMLPNHQVSTGVHQSSGGVIQIALEWCDPKKGYSSCAVYYPTETGTKVANSRYGGWKAKSGEFNFTG